MTSTIYKFEYRQGIVVVTFSAAMLWKLVFVSSASSWNRQSTLRQAYRFAIGRLIFTRERQTRPILSQAGESLVVEAYSVLGR